jgi:FRG domain-containing protein
VKNWLDVVDALYEGSWSQELRRFRSPFAFRGLSRVNHTLSSSLVRLTDGREDVPRVELALLRNFRKYAHEEARGTDSVWDWLALGQHRGLPTRLLDWTYSPLVALHFATEDPSDFEEDGVVWCVNFVAANKRLPRRLRQILRQEGSDTFTVEMLSAFKTLREFDALSRDPFVVFLEPPAIDRRILNQLALFSLMSSPVATLDEWVKEHPDLCRRVVVPARLKWEIRDKLDQANVNERVLFPGLDGLSRWLARYYMPTPRPARGAREGGELPASNLPGERPERARRVRPQPARRRGK